MSAFLRPKNWAIGPKSKKYSLFTRKRSLYHKPEMSAPTRAPSVILAPIHVLEDLSVSLSVRRGTLPSLLIVSKAGEVQPSTAPIPGFRVTRLSVNVSSGKLVLAWRMTYQLHPRERMQQPSKGWPMTSGPSLSLLLLCSCFDWFYDCQNIQKNLCDWEETWNKVVIKIENYWQINWYCTTFAECTSVIIARKTMKKWLLECLVVTGLL